MKKDFIDKFSDKVANFLRNLVVEHTVRSLLEKELGEEDFERVITYADKVILTHRPYSRSQALRWAFDWKDSPEGFGYWERIHDHLWIKDRMDKRMSRLRKLLLVSSIVIFLACMYKIITL